MHGDDYEVVVDGVSYGTYTITQVNELTALFDSLDITYITEEM